MMASFEEANKWNSPPAPMLGGVVDLKVRSIFSL
jgi:hypothetical protein